MQARAEVSEYMFESSSPARSRQKLEKDEYIFEFGLSRRLSALATPTLTPGDA
jgi:hypothetical protein